jgi:MFS family permease
LPRLEIPLITSLSQVIKELAKQWGKSNTAITFRLTVSLILRFLGAAIFRLAADRFGQKWPFVVNCALLIILKMAIGFYNNYNQFVICRTLFGIAMGVYMETQLQRRLRIALNVPEVWSLACFNLAVLWDGFLLPHLLGALSIYLKIVGDHCSGSVPDHRFS